MSITRTVDSDDSGGGTDGTIHNAAWLTAIYDALDGRWSRSTKTSTGAQNNFSISEADLLICNNATDLTITGFVAPASPAKPGKRLYVVSTGAGNVLLTHQSGSSTAANRLINFATSGNTPLAAGSGVAIYVYDDANSRWRLISHQQGGWITPGFSAGDYTALTAGTWTVGSGDVGTGAYLLRDKTLTVAFYLSTTTVVQSGGNPTILQIANTAWGGFTATKAILDGAIINDNGAGNGAGFMQVAAAGTVVQFGKAPTTQFAAATNATNLFGELQFEVT